LNKFEVLFPVAGAGSESLLELEELQNISGKHILIVTGVQGKPFLEETLLKRGATVSRWECYQREKPVNLSEQLAKVFSLPLKVVMLHSTHAAQNFIEAKPDSLISKDTSVIVGARSIAEVFSKKNWQGKVVVADSPMTKDMFKSLIESLKKS